jgi:hypothetical protein
LDNSPWKNPGGKASATDLEIFIIQQENIEIFLQKIGLYKILSQTSMKCLQDEVQLLSQPLEALCFRKPQHKSLCVRRTAPVCIIRPLHAPYVTLYGSSAWLNDLASA